jgi:poly(A) polymerase
MAASRPDTSSSLDPALAVDGAAPAWMTDANTVAVIAALERRGFAGCARFVGGCLRNTITGHPVDDIDIATTLTPDQVVEALAAAGLKSAPTGIEHGTVTGISGGKPFEITTLRRDVATDGRRATVAFTEDWNEDALRRDFRLNTLYADPAGRLFDPTGEGLADARAGRVVFVGDAMARVREDYLRILRFFRFFAWYATGEPDAAAVAACSALRGMLSGRAAERTSKELLKMLAAPDPRAAVRLMADTGVLGAVLPGVADLKRFEALVEIETGQLGEADAELRLAALLPDGSAAMMAERLRLSNAQRGRLVAATATTPSIVSWMGAREARRAIYTVGIGAFADRVKLGWAAGKPAAAPQWRVLLSQAQVWTPPVLPIAGADVAAAGVAQGPMVGAVMREVEAWWIDQDFLDDRDQALERMKAVIEGMGA